MPGRESILVFNAAFLDDAVATLSCDFDVQIADEPLGAAPERLGSAVGILIGRGTAPQLRDVVPHLPALRAVAVARVTVQDYFQPDTFPGAVRILHTPDMYVDPVAEFSLMMAIAGLRNASRAHEAMRAGGWGLGQRAGSGRVRTAVRRLMGDSSAGRAKSGEWLLHRSTIGILGFGQISRRLVELLRPFQCDVAIASDHMNGAEATALGVRRASRDEVLSARVVFLLRRLTDETRHEIGAAELDQLSPGAVLVNTGRGGLVDTNALAARLARGDVFACLDVFESEPLPKRHPLRSLPNVLLTPHIAGSSAQVHREAGADVADRLSRVLSGESVEGAATFADLAGNR